MRVLYVEDEKFLAEAVKHNLEKHDMDVDLATDGEECVPLAGKELSAERIGGLFHIVDRVDLG